VSTQSSIVEMNCHEVRRELVNYTEGDLIPELLAAIERHLKNCRGCKAVYAGTQNIIILLGSGAAFEPPKGFSQRLRQRLFETRSALLWARGYNSVRSS
jgi:predicted anti-sigma-YlaC factor YlaD